MNLVVFTHPDFLPSESMPRFARMLVDGMTERGHRVITWAPTSRFHRVPLPTGKRKWLGYIDQFVLFPMEVRWRLRRCPADTLFVFADQALGPWVRLVASRPHVIHCHDFMALRSSLGEHPENPTSATGKIYQRFILRGFRKGHSFISISHETQRQLHRFLGHTPKLSTVVHNGLNHPFAPMAEQDAREVLAPLGMDIPEAGFLLHVGGNQWYKNRSGVLSIYEGYSRICSSPLPIWLIGQPPTPELLTLQKRAVQPEKIRFLSGLSNSQVQAAYSMARALVFPSLAEGFGWPVAEAMACGCAVLTTGEAPLTEVGGDAASYIPLMQQGGSVTLWADHAAQVLLDLLNEDDTSRAARRVKGLAQAKKFDAPRAIDAYEAMYASTLAGHPLTAG